MWKKTLFERECKWTGVNGKNFHCIKYLDNIFYSIEAVKEEKQYISYGSYCAVIGGSGHLDLALKSINGTLVKGQKPITEEDVKEAIKKMSKEILKSENCQKHSFTPPRMEDEWY